MPSILETENYTFQLLQKAQYSKSLFDLLSQLTSAPLPSEKDFCQYLENMKQQHNKHINLIGISKSSGKAVAFGSVIIINSVMWGKIGKIENIVTCKSVRGQGLGKMVIQILNQLGLKQGCNKITLFCQEKNIKFYEKLGFKLEGEIYACYKK